MKEEIRSDLPVKASFVLHRLGRRALSEIVVTRQAGVAREVRIAVPHLIVFFKISIGSGEPGGIPVPEIFLQRIVGTTSTNIELRKGGCERLR